MAESVGRRQVWSVGPAT